MREIHSVREATGRPYIPLTDPWLMPQTRASCSMGMSATLPNDQGANYDPAASADAWARVLAFFGERLSASAGS